MKWFKGVPDKDGFYFWKKRRNSVWWKWDVMCLDAMYCWCGGVDSDIPTSGWWAGPILLPKE